MISRGALLALALSIVAMVSGCGDDGSTDAGGDTSVMDSRVDTGVDSAVRCMPACNMTQSCCDDGSGGVTCISSVDDPNNCGGCDVVCAEGRGTTCELGSCVCGRIEMGCLGNDRSWCCPPRDGTGTHYCADFTTDSQDCGGCNEACTPETSSDCRLSQCVCGDTGGPCAGTPEDMCCPSATDMFDCRDTTSDTFHCGGCGRACMIGERCEMSTCTLGASCASACASGEICCDGTCCDRVSCARGEC